MKWIYSGNKRSREDFELWDQEQIVLTLHIDQSLGSARIDCGNEKRAFFINKEGFLKNKTVMRNEYGVRIGKLIYENQQSEEGTLEYNEEQFHYSIRRNPVTEILLYKADSLQAVSSCRLDTITGTVFNKIVGGRFPEAIFHTLLLAFSWYLFLPVRKEQLLQYAT